MSVSKFQNGHYGGTGLLISSNLADESPWFDEIINDTQHSKVELEAGKHASVRA